MHNDPIRTRPFSEVLSDTFERGDQESVAQALQIPRQHVAEMLADVRRNPFDASMIVTEQLRRNGNARADEPFLALSRRLGFTSYQIRHSGDAAMADVLKEVSDVLNARAEAMTDGAVDYRELRAEARQVSELAERAAAYAESLTRRADEMERTARFSGRRS